MDQINITELDKKIFELVDKNYSESRIAKELGISIEQVRKSLENYATFKHNAPVLEERKKTSSVPNLRRDGDPRDGYIPHMLDNDEYSGVEQYGDSYYIDGVEIETQMSRELTPIEREVYELMTGSFDGVPKNVEEIAREMGMDKEEVTNIINRINEKIYDE